MSVQIKPKKVLVCDFCGRDVRVISDHSHLSEEKHRCIPCYPTYLKNDQGYTVKAKVNEIIGSIEYDLVYYSPSGHWYVKIDAKGDSFFFNRFIGSDHVSNNSKEYFPATKREYINTHKIKI